MKDFLKYIALPTVIFSVANLLSTEFIFLLFFYILLFLILPSLFNKYFLKNNPQIWKLLLIIIVLPILNLIVGIFSPYLPLNHLDFDSPVFLFYSLIPSGIISIVYIFNKYFDDKKLKIFFGLIAGFILIILICSLVLKLIYNKVDFEWTSDSRYMYDECEKFGKSYPCSKATMGTFAPPIGISGCEYIGIWIKDNDTTLFKVKKGCYI